MRVSARKSRQEHLRVESIAKVRHIIIIYNIIYIILIYNNILTCSMYGGFATPEAFCSLRSPLPQNNSKKKGEGIYLPFLLYAANHSLRTVSQSMMTGFSSITVMVGASSIILLKTGPTPVFSNTFFNSSASIKRAAAHPLHTILHPLHT